MFFFKKDATVVKSVPIQAGNPIYIARSNLLVFGGNGSGKTADIGIPNAVEALRNGNSLLVTCVDDEYEKALEYVLAEKAVEAVNIDGDDLLAKTSEWYESFGDRQSAVFFKLPQNPNEETASKIGRHLMQLLLAAEGHKRDAKDRKPVTVILDDIHEIPHIPQMESFMLNPKNPTLHILMMARPTERFNEFYNPDSFFTVAAINSDDIVNGPGEAFIAKWCEDNKADSGIDLGILKENGHNEMLIFLKAPDKSAPIEVAKVSLARRQVG